MHLKCFNSLAGANEISGQQKAKYRPTQQRPFTENKNGAGEDLYLSGGTSRRTTTGEDELGAGSEQSDRTAEPEKRGRRGEKASRRGRMEKSPSLVNLIRPIAAVRNAGF